jgi:glutamate-1-semialdehyde aminotransferase
MLRTITEFSKSNIYRSLIHDLIPGGAHTYSKGDDQFPMIAPAAIDFGRGSHIWDIDGNEFLDCSMGLTSVSLGHAYKPVTDAIINELNRGVNFQRPSILEMKTAEVFLSLLPQHQMIKFAKNGSIVTTAAVKLARAYTGRKLIAFPGDHPFYSYDDWFIGTTPSNRGVPSDFTNLSVTFKSCDIESLRDLFNKYPGQIAGVITEPEKSSCYGCSCNKSPAEFLKAAIDLAHENGAIFILDEMVTGFKTDFPGTITKFDLKPDLATWGKGVANGFSFCALTGTKEVMELGGIRKKGEEKVFLISTTHGGETTAMAAAIATINEFSSKNVIEHVNKTGRAIISLCSEVIERHELNQFVSLVKCDWQPLFIFKDLSGQVSMPFRTLVMQEMIKSGVLFQGIFVPCYSHSDEDVKYFAEAFDKAMGIYKLALEKGIEFFLVGEPTKPVFRKLL